MIRVLRLGLAGVLFFSGLRLLGQELEQGPGGRLAGRLGAASGLWPALWAGLLLAGTTGSSSLVTVLTVSLMGAGRLTPEGALGAVIGANIGTTAAVWALDLAAGLGSPLLWGLGIMAAGGALVMARPGAGRPLLALGTLLCGLGALEQSCSQLALESGAGALAGVLGAPLPAFVCGTLCAGLLQSSAAGLGILCRLAELGLVGLLPGLAMTAGLNLGTCSTALLAALGTGKGAGRAAARLHVGLNLLGCALTVPLFTLLAGTSAAGLQASARSICLFHTGFNLLCAAIVLPLRRQFLGLMGMQ